MTAPSLYTDSRVYVLDYLGVTGRASTTTDAFLSFSDF